MGITEIERLENGLQPPLFLPALTINVVTQGIRRAVAILSRKRVHNTGGRKYPGSVAVYELKTKERGDDAVNVEWTHITRGVSFSLKQRDPNRGQQSRHREQTFPYIIRSKLGKVKFFILCDVIFLVRLPGKFEIDHSWKWNGYREQLTREMDLCVRFANLVKYSASIGSLGGRRTFWKPDGTNSCSWYASQWATMTKIGHDKCFTTESQQNAYHSNININYHVIIPIVSPPHISRRISVFTVRFLLHVMRSFVRLSQCTGLPFFVKQGSRSAFSSEGAKDERVRWAGGVHAPPGLLWNLSGVLFLLSLYCIVKLTKFAIKTGLWSGHMTAAGFIHKAIPQFVEHLR